MAGVSAYATPISMPLVSKTPLKKKMSNYKVHFLFFYT